MTSGVYIKTAEHLAKISRALQGKSKSEEHKVKIKEARKKQVMTRGERHVNWKGGQSVCIDCQKTLRQYFPCPKRCWECYQSHNRGENHPSWKGGYKSLYPPEFNAKLKLIIRTRDQFTCCLCGRTEREELEELNRVLSVNHIDFDKNNCAEDNLNTLCLRCNVRINREREYWTDYFKTIS